MKALFRRSLEEDQAIVCEEYARDVNPRISESEVADKADDLRSPKDGREPFRTKEQEEWGEWITLAEASLWNDSTGSYSVDVERESHGAETLHN